jgi:hypothetical protein
MSSLWSRGLHAWEGGVSCVGWEPSQRLIDAPLHLRYASQSRYALVQPDDAVFMVVDTQGPWSPTPL